MKPIYALLGALVVAPAAAQPFAIVPSPDSSETFNTLSGIDGTASDDVWAVGGYIGPPPAPFHPGRMQTLAMRWDGNGWNVVPTPNPADGDSNRLWDVDAVAPDLAWAVGHQGGNVNHPLIVRWDGAAWAEEDIPPTGPGTPSPVASLFGIHAVSPSDVWAVGTGGNPSGGPPSSIPVAYHWDGSDWDVTILPTVQSYHNDLLAVHASAPDNVWAVGYSGESRGDHDALVYRWDGTSVTHVPTPFTDGSTALIAVAVLAPDDVWVTADHMGAEPPITAHWNGTSWTNYPENRGGGALLAFAPDDVYGFGDVVTHWDGTSWTEVSEIGGVTFPSLVSATGLPDGTVWASGRWMETEGTNPPLHTLTVRGARLPVAADGPAGTARPAGLTLAAPQPNPVRGAARLTLALAAAQAVRVEAFDALGRRVAVLHDGPLASGTHALDLDASAWPAGVYVLRARAETGALITQRLVVAR